MAYFGGFKLFCLIYFVCNMGKEMYRPINYKNYHDRSEITFTAFPKTLISSGDSIIMGGISGFSD